jgi:hypothetical protein
MLSPSGNAAAFPFASMLNFGEPLAIAARDCRATSSEDREDSGLQRYKACQFTRRIDHRSIVFCVGGPVTPSEIKLGQSAHLPVKRG